MTRPGNDSLKQYRIRLATPEHLTFFSPPVSRKFRRDPSGGFPARFRGAFRFGGDGHFVSDDPSEKIS